MPIPDRGSFFLRLAAYTAGVLPERWMRALYRLGPITRGLRSLLNRSAPRGLTEVEIAGGALKGLVLELDLQAEKDLWLGAYEPEVQAALQRFLMPGMTVYDVGANLGYHTLLMATLVGPDGKVIAFEPHTENLARLRRTLALNRVEDRVHVVPMAVVEARGLRRYLIHPSAGMGRVGNSAERPERFSGELDVEAIDLDAFVYEEGNPPPEWVKMDIEGGEAHALAGMKRVLRQNRPSLLLEVHGEAAGRSAWRELADAGYSLHELRQGYPPLREPTAMPPKAYLLARPA